MGHPRSGVASTQQQVPHRAFSPVRNDKGFCGLAVRWGRAGENYHGRWIPVASWSLDAALKRRSSTVVRRFVTVYPVVCGDVEERPFQGRVRAG
jgi:hypothetical protein